MASGADRIDRWEHETGLVVVHQQLSRAPVVGMQLRVAVGSADEGPDEHGAAHVVEHLLFRGTDRWPDGTLAMAVEAAGGVINAWTSFDETVVHLAVPRADATIAIARVLDAALNSCPSEEAVAGELAVIGEELRRGRDLPTRRLTHALFEAAFDGHPYGRPVIGSGPAIEALDAETLRAFHRRWYRPSAMTLVVVGDVSGDDVRRIVDGALAGAAVGGADPQRVRSAASEQTASRGVALALPVEGAHVALGFRGPAITDPDAPLLELLLLVLGQGESSRLFEELQRRRGLVSNVYTFLHAPREPGLAIVGAALADPRLEDPDAGRIRPGDGEAVLDSVLDALMREIAALHHVPVGRDELARAQVLLRSDAVYQRQTVQGAAQRIGHHVAAGGTLGFEASYLDAASRATPGQLRDVARRWLVPERLTVAVLTPNAWELELDGDVLAQAASEAFDRAEAGFATARAVDVADAVVVHRFERGPLVIVERDPGAELFAVRLAAPGGVVHEPAERAGQDHLLAELLLSGTQQRSGPELARRLDAMAATLSGFSGRHSVGVQATALREDFHEAMGLVAEVVRDASFPRAEVERLRRETIQRIQALDDSLPSSAYRIFEETLFAGHAYARSPLGTLDSVRRLDRAGLVARHRAVFSADRLVISVVGDVEPSEVLAAVGLHFGNDPREGSSALGERPVVPRAVHEGPSEPIVVLRHRPREQVHVVMGFAAPPVGQMDHDALQVLAAILGGQAGVLFRTLRDELGLVYSISASVFGGVDAGAFSVYFATSPERLDASIEAVRRTLASVREVGVDDGTVERARRAMIGTRLLARQRSGARAALHVSHEILGLGWEFAGTLEQRVGEVSAESIRAAALRWLDADRVIVVILGPEAGTSPAAAPSEDDESL